MLCLGKSCIILPGEFKVLTHLESMENILCLLFATFAGVGSLSMLLLTRLVWVRALLQACHCGCAEQGAITLPLWGLGSHLFDHIWILLRLQDYSYWEELCFKNLIEQGLFVVNKTTYLFTSRASFNFLISLNPIPPYSGWHNLSHLGLCTPFLSTPCFHQNRLIMVSISWYHLNHQP